MFLVRFSWLLLARAVHVPDVPGTWCGLYLDTSHIQAAIPPGTRRSQLRLVAGRILLKVGGIPLHLEYIWISLNLICEFPCLSVGVKNGLFRSVLMLLRILALLRVSSNLNAEAEPKQRRSCRFQTRSSWSSAHSEVSPVYASLSSMESSKGFPNAGSGFSSKVPRRPRGLQRTMCKKMPSHALNNSWMNHWSSDSTVEIHSSFLTPTDSSENTTFWSQVPEGSWNGGVDFDGKLWLLLNHAKSCVATRWRDMVFRASCGGDSWIQQG